MSSTDSSAGDHAYFQAIEACFIRLRGAPLLLSPADWQLARSWHESGIPLSLILETLEQVFAKRSESGVGGRVQGLRYCAPAIEAAWKMQAEIQATGSRSTPPALDLRSRLDTLAKTVRELGFDAVSVADELESLDGPLDEVEGDLVDLDRKLLQAAEESLDRADLDKIAHSVARSLERVRARMDEEEAARVRLQLHREAVRRRCDLPVLSLFEDRI